MQQRKQHAPRARGIEREADRPSGLSLTSHEMMEAEREIAHRHFSERPLRERMIRERASPDMRFESRFEYDDREVDRNGETHAERELWRGVGNGTAITGWFLFLVVIGMMIHNCASGGGQ